MFSIVTVKPIKMHDMWVKSHLFFACVNALTAWLLASISLSLRQQQHATESGTFGQLQAAGITVAFCRAQQGVWKKVCNTHWHPYLSGQVSMWMFDIFVRAALRGVDTLILKLVFNLLMHTHRVVINMSHRRRFSMALSLFYDRGKEGCEGAAKRKRSSEVLSGWDHPACCSLLLNIWGERWYPGTWSNVLSGWLWVCVQYAVAVPFHLLSSEKLLAGGVVIKSIYWCLLFFPYYPIFILFFSHSVRGDFHIQLSEWIQFAAYCAVK